MVILGGNRKAHGTQNKVRYDFNLKIFWKWKQNSKNLAYKSWKQIKSCKDILDWNWALNQKIMKNDWLN